jgi:hypothetical protein
MLRGVTPDDGLASLCEMYSQWYARDRTGRAPCLHIRVRRGSYFLVLASAPGVARSFQAGRLAYYKHLGLLELDYPH